MITNDMNVTEKYFSLRKKLIVQVFGNNEDFSGVISLLDDLYVDDVLVHVAPINTTQQQIWSECLHECALILIDSGRFAADISGFTKSKLKYDLERMRLNSQIVFFYDTENNSNEAIKEAIKEDDFATYFPRSILNNGAIILPILINQLKIYQKTAELFELQHQEEISERLYAELYEYAPDMFVSVDPRTAHVIRCNQTLLNKTGYSLSDVIGHPVFNLYHPDSLAKAFQAFKLFQQYGIVQNFELLLKKKTGEPIDVLLNVTSVRDSKGTILHSRSWWTDITNQKKAQAIVKKQANFDYLTEIPNRRYFIELLEALLQTQQDQEQHFALFFIDLDNFKEINDSLGHASGDVLLIDVANRLRQCVRSPNIVGRIGGDEFVAVIMHNVDDFDKIEFTAQLILRALNTECTLGINQIYLSASLGITFFPRDGRDVSTLFKNADQAMYAAKQNGRNRFSYFTKKMARTQKYRSLVARSLQNGVDENDFFLRYQPIFGQNLDVPVKVEVLLRWNHSELGLIMPEVFIPIAEDSGMIHELGNWVFYTATEQLAAWRKHYNIELAMSINISPLQVNAPLGIHKKWVTHLKKLGLPGRNIILEITEGTLMSSVSNVRQKLEMFRDSGIRMAVDDFGIGYSSLAYLKYFEVDFLKIDRSFVESIDQNAVDNRDVNHYDLAIVRAIIVMAKTMGLQTIAEGVERMSQQTVLKELGCDYFQGYLLSSPLLAEDFEHLLQKRLPTRNK